MGQELMEAKNLLFRKEDLLNALKQLPNQDLPLEINQIIDDIYPKYPLTLFHCE